MVTKVIPYIIVLSLAISCLGPGHSTPPVERDTFTNPVFPVGSSPRLIHHGGYYYYTQTMNDHVSVWKAPRIADIANAQEHVVYAPGDIYHISAPQLHMIDGKWYLSFSSDKPVL